MHGPLACTHSCAHTLSVPSIRSFVRPLVRCVYIVCEAVRCGPSTHEKQRHHNHRQPKTNAKRQEPRFSHRINWPQTKLFTSTRLLNFTKITNCAYVGLINRNVLISVWNWSATPNALHRHYCQLEYRIESVSSFLFECAVFFHFPFFSESNINVVVIAIATVHVCSLGAWHLAREFNWIESQQ